MDIAEKLTWIEDYLRIYFDEMLIEDIKKIRDAKLDFTFPFILLVSTGIDFLGGLKHGFERDNSKSRSRYFIEEWMGKVNELYEDKRISEIIYNSVRCGVSHQAMYKAEIESSSWLYPKEKHLNHMVDFNGKDRIYIHALQFIEDFIKAQETFREQYVESHPDEVYGNLTTMLQTDEMLEFPNLVDELKARELTFDAKIVAKENPEVKDIDFEAGRITRNDDIEVTTTATTTKNDVMVTRLVDDNE